MIPEEQPHLIYTMSSPPPPLSPGVPSVPSVSPLALHPSPAPSPPCSPGSVIVQRRSPGTRHLTHLDPWRRHSWEPGAALQGCPPDASRSVSLEDLDLETLALLLGGALVSRRGRRSVTQEGSLTSLTEEEVRPEPAQHHSVLEEQSNQMQGCSASAPTLCVLRRTASTSSTSRPRSHCYEPSVFSPGLQNKTKSPSSPSSSSSSFSSSSSPDASPCSFSFSPLTENRLLISDL